MLPISARCLNEAFQYALRLGWLQKKASKVLPNKMPKSHGCERKRNKGHREDQHWRRQSEPDPVHALIASWGRDYSLLNRSLCKFGILSKDLQQSTQRDIISNQARRLGSCSIRCQLETLHVCGGRKLRQSLSHRPQVRTGPSRPNWRCVRYDSSDDGIRSARLKRWPKLIVAEMSPQRRLHAWFNPDQASRLGRRCDLQYA